MKHAFIITCAALLGCLAVGCASSGPSGEECVDHLTLDVSEVVSYASPAKNQKMKVQAVLPPVRFEFDSVQLTPEGQEVLASIAQNLAAYPGAVIVVGGHTDTSGPDAYNEVLSERRAQEVKRLLQQEYGLKNPIQTVGNGSSRPSHSNDTRSGRQANRRAELHLTK